MSDKKINGVLVRLSISTFNNSRQDAAITDEVRLRKSLGVGAGKWVKYKLPDEALEPIRKYAGEARRRSYELTLPWEDGYRLLTLRSQPGFQKEFTTFMDTFNEHVEAFVEQYPKWVEQAKIMHSKTFNPDDYPDEGAIAKCFNFAVEYTPVPTSSHFISGLAKETIEVMKQDLEQRNQQRVETAVADIWNRLVAPVQKMADTLADKKQIFRDTLVENIREVVALVPQLNLTNNLDIVRAAQVIEQQLSKVDADTLREDMSLRRDVAEKAKELVARFGAVGKRKFAN